MSTPTPARPLFAKLFDDAAVFPPGNHPLIDALDRRKERTGTPDATYVGPLLLPPPLVAAALPQPEPLLINVVGRPGTAQADVIAAATAVAEHNWHALTGVQVAHNPAWRELIELGVPVSIEVPHGDSGIALLDELSGDAMVRAKLRTGSTATTPVPQPDELATFIDGCVRRELGFKLTGGMHHGLTGEYSGERQFGFLNVLAAVDAAIGGADVTVLAALLDERRSEVVLDRVRAIDDTRAHSIRDLFQSYGCCDVEDPINDLMRLRVVDETH